MAYNPTEFKPRVFNPETDVRVCFMVPSDTGGIISKAVGIPDSRKTQYGYACNPKGRLPNKTEHDKVGLTIDPNHVTCPKCQKTKIFQEAFAHQTGYIFDAEKIALGVPLDPVPEPEETLGE